MTTALSNSPPAVPISPEQARFTSCLVGPNMVLVTVDGELDATNAADLAKYIQRVIDGRRGLIVDLRGLEFFGTAGFSTLHHVNVTSSRRDVKWVVLPGRLVNRVLEICDPERGLPVASTLERAMAALSAKGAPATPLSPA